MTRQDPHTRITDRILAELEQGTRPWLKPWSGGDMAASGRTRPLRATGQPYRGINVLLLWLEAEASGFVSPSWMTYKQAQALGAQVRKGERGATLIYYGDSSKTVTDDQTGEEKERGFRFLKTYTVLWRRSTACPSAFTSCRNPRPRGSGSRPPRHSLRASPRPCTTEGIRAITCRRPTASSYRRSRPSTMPMATTPRGATRLSTGRATKAALIAASAARNGATKAYAREELVAELGAAFLTADHQGSRSTIAPSGPARPSSCRDCKRRGSRCCRRARARARSHPDATCPFVEQRRRG